MEIHSRELNISLAIAIACDEVLSVLYGDYVLHENILHSHSYTVTVFCT